MCLFILYVGEGCEHLWRPEDNFWVTVPSFHHLGFEAQTQLISCSGSCPYLMAILSPSLIFIFSRDRILLCGPGSP